jgi:hypothetical protein
MDEHQWTTYGQTGQNKLTMDKLYNSEDAKRFLRSLTIYIPEEKVRKVVAAFKNGSSLYELWAHGRYRATGHPRTPICGKETVYKIKRFYKEGKLDPYLDYLRQSPIVDKPKVGQGKDLKETGITKEQPEHDKVLTEKPTREADQATRLREHFHEVVETAKVLASNVEKLLYYKSHGSTAFRGDIVKGFRSYWGSPEDAKVIEIKEYLARCALVHYEHKFGKSPYDYWEEVTKENATRELADNLVRLASGKAFELCPRCLLCVEIAGIEPVSPDLILFLDEKTGKTTYMPNDF